MTTQPVIHWGILGAARITERVLPALAQAEHSRLMAIASRRPEAARQLLARTLPDAQVTIYDDYDSLLNDDTIHAVYLPLANHDHAHWTLRAIAKGKHVLCEKPLALNVADIAAIKDAAHHHHVQVMEGFMYRFHPQHQRVQALLKQGIIGEVMSVRSTFSFLMRPERYYRLAEPTSNGGGALWDIGCYAIHALRQFFTHPPIAICARSHYVESGADLTTTGILDFGSGKFAQFSFNFSQARRSEYELIGTQGGIHCANVWATEHDSPHLSWWTEKDGQHHETLAPSNHFALEIAHFNHCIQTHTPPLLSLDEAQQNCQILVALMHAAKEERWIYF